LALRAFNFFNGTFVSRIVPVIATLAL